ncbi:MAG: tRNA (5-methylaminomethyl-2-thiouridine)(34)-methyltransferase MnmD [Lautropia sp.]|nr:tRNA (5-methylaminomethyl-2-thiouridine)(34)-methyltransferase MnmD [Lautropia sp.]
MEQTDTDSLPGTGPVSADIGLIDWQGDTPFSPRYGDRYHTLSGARAQSEHVFLGGCGLPGAWSGQQDWCILETGFGLGLNFLATWACWLQHPERPRRLRFISTEAHPVGADDIRRAARLDPALQALGERLANCWPHAWPARPTEPRPTRAGEKTDDAQQTDDQSTGIPFLKQDFSQPEGRVELLILWGDTATCLRNWRHLHGPLGADSIFLDGFDPKKNPAMWSADTLKQVAAHGKPDTRMATWCVARSVRDAATEAGFSVGRLPGLPPKRHCLAGSLGNRKARIMS